MDNDEDEDGDFTKWMSSYWGHSTGEDSAWDRRHSIRRQRRDRRASLPCQAQLDRMILRAVHTPTTVSLPVHIRNQEQRQEQTAPWQRQESRSETTGTQTQARESHICAISELAGTFAKKLCFRSRNVTSLSDAGHLCLICHDGIPNGAGKRELHTYKEMRRSQPGCAHVGRGAELGRFHIEQEECQLTQHRLSLRRK